MASRVLGRDPPHVPGAPIRSTRTPGRLVRSTARSHRPLCPRRPAPPIADATGDPLMEVDSEAAAGAEVLRNLFGAAPVSACPSLRLWVPRHFGSHEALISRRLCSHVYSHVYSHVCSRPRLV